MKLTRWQKRNPRMPTRQTYNGLVVKAGTRLGHLLPLAGKKLLTLLRSG